MVWNMRRLVLTSLLILCPSMVWATAYTSTQAGDFNSASTWGGGGYPANGDTATVNHPVLVSGTAVVGTGGAPGTDELIVNSVLTIAPGASLTTKGDVRFNNGSSLTEGAGSSFLTSSGNYEIEYDGTVSFSLEGTAGSHAVFGAESGYYTSVDAQGYGDKLNLYTKHCTINRVGNASTYSFRFAGTTALSIVFDNTLFVGNGRMAYGSYDTPHAGSVFKVLNSDFRSPAHSQFIYTPALAVNFAANSHVLSGNTFKGDTTDRYNFIQLGGTSPWVITDNVGDNVAMRVSVLNTSHGNLWHTNLVSQEQYQYEGTANGSSVYDNVALGTGNNSHFFSVINTGSITFSNNFSESQYAAADTINHYLPTEHTGNSTVTVEKAIAIGGNAVVLRDPSSGLSRAGSVNLNNITHVFQSGTKDGLLFYESYAYTGNGQLRNSIEYSLDANAMELINGNAASPTVTYSDYNNIWNKTFASRYLTGITVSSGMSHDIASDPIFRNPSANTSTWDASLGGPGTIANVVSKMISRNGFDASGNATTYNSNYTVDNLLGYIRYAFTPTNPYLKTAGEGGTYIGAMDVATLGNPAALLMVQ